MIHIARASLPEPVRILGLRLLPLSLGRYRLLQRFECSFVSDQPVSATIDALIADLFIGIVICSMPVKDFCAWLDTPEAQRETEAWGKRIRAECKVDGFNILEKFGLFKYYLESGIEIPAYQEETSDGRQSGSHWSHAVEVALRQQLGWTQEEVNETPMAKALADYFRWAESEGLITLLAPEQVEYNNAQAAANDAALAQLKATLCPV